MGKTHYKMAIFHSYVKLPRVHTCLVVSMIFYYPFIYGMSSQPHWRTHIFQDGYCTTNQIRTVSFFPCSFLFYSFACPFSFPLPFLFLSSSFHVFSFPFLFLSSSVLFLFFSFCVLFLFRFSFFSCSVLYLSFSLPCLFLFVPLPFLYCHKTMESSRAPKRTSGSLEKTMGFDNGSYT